MPARSAQAPATFATCLHLSLRMSQRLSLALVTCQAGPPLADADTRCPPPERCPRGQSAVPFEQRTSVLGRWPIGIGWGRSPLPVAREHANHEAAKVSHPVWSVSR
jgi:hypothetical protein